MNDIVSKPAHYISNGVEARHVIQAWRLGWELGTAVKYILRAGRKDDELVDLRKCREYLRFALETPNELTVYHHRTAEKPIWQLSTHLMPHIVAKAFGLSERRAKALGAILCGWPHKSDVQKALAEIEAEIEAVEEARQEAA